MSTLEAEGAKFKDLQRQLKTVWRELQHDPSYECTSVIVPSLSVNQEELAKVTGAAFYEERLMFALIRLRNPNARLIYLTSQPVHPDVVDYYLQLLDNVPASHARRRLHMLSVFDSSPRPLSEKILERPYLLARLRKYIGNTQRAYLTCYNCTVLERRLAISLDIPLNGLDPDLLRFGTKSGNRKVFAEAGVNHPAGFEDLHSEDDIVRALLELRGQRPRIERAVVKINEGFGGEGNAVFTYPPAAASENELREQLHGLSWLSVNETYENFMHKFAAMGGIVEELIAAQETRSPSVQMRILPDGETHLVSSHEQVLGGSTGQAYLGCRFPANDDYRTSLQDEAQKIGEVLSQNGIIGRFGIDFLASRDNGSWTTHAIEINLRMGGTTPPFHALEFLTGGELDAGSGKFLAPNGQAKFYSATDNLKSPAYRGLLPEDLFDIVWHRGIGYRHATGTGVLFYMIGALSQYGKLGMTCIGNSPEAASRLFAEAVRTLDECTAANDPGRVAPMSDRYLEME
ncbi:MAG: peptide ligase PGM1-related protein [Gammaproteobacteria bacterium]|nr:peptide ligase PGM1-related protein [Gammaproteobacteria bacterium]MDH3410719.1 peptide ligase PGM1-related protein [Gammaproteobacteria bacterium]MDH3551707.1 peptide ligase PGM1-related protein [Gammaproteobacteria bacterium]